MKNNLNNPLLIVIIILIILFLAEKTFYYYKDQENILANYNNKQKVKLIENFEEGKIFSTLITKLDPIEGDSSTIVTIEGKNLNLVGKVSMKIDTAN